MGELRSRGATAAALTTAALVASLAFAPQASAAISVNEDTNCAVGSVCVWAHGDYKAYVRAMSPTRGAVRFSGGNLTVQNLDNNSSDVVRSMRSGISSMKTRVNTRMCFYQDPNFGGWEFKIGGWEDWRNVPSWIDNTISSFKPC